MVETQNLMASIQGPGLEVELQPQFQAASLRYFDSAGAFAGVIRSISGLDIPTGLRATHRVHSADGQGMTVLAWRSPSETTLLTTENGLIDALQSAAARLADGCMVDQRGGLLVFGARGEAVPELVAKKAGYGAMPAIGESRRTRFADVAVSIAKLRADQTLFIVDRIYAPHVMASIRISAENLAAPLYD